MFQLDDDFLRDLGVANLPDDQKQALVQHIYEELEMRVGTKLAEGLDDEKMQEFDAIMQRDEPRVRTWLDTYLPGYAQQEEYRQFMGDVAENPPIEALANYAAAQWLSRNRPGYQEVVARVLEEIKNEIITNRDAILAA